MKELEYPFDSDYILKKKKSIKKHLLKSNSNFVKIKIALLCGSTLGEVKNILELFLLNNGVNPVFWEGQYDRYYEEAIFSNEELKKFEPDIVYIHTSVKNIIEFPSSDNSVESVEIMINEIFERFKQIWDSIDRKFHCPIIQNNFEYLPYRVMGNADAYNVCGGVNFINQINAKFSKQARLYSGLYLNDLNYLSADFGLNNWHDNYMWYSYKYPFSYDAIPIVSQNIANIIKSLLGKNKKILALDLDNTLWGGTIGDDGVNGIKLGIESPEGMAFEDFQKYLQKLGKMGISLNICSKNDEKIARQGFRHPASILSEDDFIVFKTNWMNKDYNLKNIAHELNVIDDSMVFIDDNPFERLLVKESLPEIAIPEMLNPIEYVKVLDKSGYFEVTRLSTDDIKRNVYYKDNMQREILVNKFDNYKEYLKSLRMKSIIRAFEEENIERIVQLINKTNQFNFTTWRLNEEEVKAYKNCENNITLCANLTDKFGDNGIVSCLMASIHGDYIVVDLWVMSCRVFKRDLELAIFDELVRLCKEKGIKKIQGKYIKTKKNAVIEDKYVELGFKVCENNEKQSLSIFEIPEIYINKNTVMEVRYE